MNWVKINKNNQPEVGEAVLLRLARRPYRKGDNNFVVGYRDSDNNWFARWHNTSIGGKPTHFSYIKF